MTSKKLIIIYNQIVCFLKDNRGQGITEYGLNILFVAIALMATLVLFKGSLSNYYSDIVNFLNGI